MFGLLIIVLILGTCVGIRIRKKRRLLHKVAFPADLGCREDILLTTHIISLNNALLESYEQKIKERFLEEHPKRKERDFELLWYEMRRFFILCSLFKNVPMFSSKVDDIWHQMILFTREYAAFTNAFCCEFIHHTPTERKMPDPNGRAWFDFMYTQLFEFTPYTQEIWGKFFQNPLDQEFIKVMQNSTWSEIKSQYFRNSVMDDVAVVIIQNLKYVIQDALERKEYKKQNVPSSKSLSKYAPYLASAMIYYSVYNAHNYQRKMNALLFGTPNDGFNHTSNNCNTSCSSSSSNCGYTCSGNCNSNSCNGSCSSGSGCSSCGGHT